MKGFLVTVGLVLFLIWGGARIVNDIQFDRNCEGYLKRASDANTVELAEKNLAVAVEHLERNNMTSGHTSILYRTPDEDVGFWYDNLSAALLELREIDEEATQLERTNILMKLRESLLDEGEGGSSVTAPPGIAVFPANKAYALWGVLSGLMVLVFGVWIFILEG
jgi:hypothetical protein